MTCKPENKFITMIYANRNRKQDDFRLTNANRRYDKLHDGNRLLYNKLDTCTPCKVERINLAL